MVHPGVSCPPVATQQISAPSHLSVLHLGPSTIRSTPDCPEIFIVLAWSIDLPTTRKFGNVREREGCIDARRVEKGGKRPGKVRSGPAVAKFHPDEEEDAG